MNKSNIVFTLVFLCAAAVARAQSIATVDMEELIRLHPDTASDKKLFDQTLKDFRGENDELRQKLEALQDDFEKIRKESQDPTLSDKARKAAEERASKARDSLIAADRTAREKMQARQEQLSDMQSRMIKKTFNEIREVVRKYAEGRKLPVVFSANQVVYCDKSLDITDAILKQMNITQPAHEADLAPLNNVLTPRSTTATNTPAASK